MVCVCGERVNVFSDASILSHDLTLACVTRVRVRGAIRQKRQQRHLVVVVLNNSCSVHSDLQCVSLVLIRKAFNVLLIVLLLC